MSANIISVRANDPGIMPIAKGAFPSAAGRPNKEKPLRLNQSPVIFNTYFPLAFVMKTRDYENWGRCITFLLCVISNGENSRTAVV
jgi:hypothetical protein